MIRFASRKDYFSFYLVLLFYLSVLILPSGTVGGVNVKLLFLGLLVAHGFSQIINALLVLSSELLIAFFGFVFFSIYGVYGYVNGIELHSISSAWIMFTATFFSALVPFILVPPKKRMIIIGDALIWSTAVFSVAKVMIFFLAITGFVDLDSFFGWMYVEFGYSPITYNYGWLLRINVPADFVLVPILILLLNINKFAPESWWRNYRIIRNLAIILIIFSGILTMSRFYWAYMMVAIAVGMYIRNPLVLVRAVGVLSLVSIISVILNGDAIFSFMHERYFGQNAQDSDSVREVLSPLLWQAISDAPLFGHGLGSYLADAVFFEDLPWNYVLQWLSFLNQFGVLGVGFLLVLLLMPMMPILLRLASTRILVGDIVLLGVYFVWLSVGFFNTYLLSSSAGAAYAGYFLIASALVNKRIYA